MITRSVLCILSITILPIIISGCGSTPELQSSWNRNEIVVDGNGSDWKSNTYYLNEQHVTVGIRNDDSDLYVCLMSEESQFRRQLMGLGFTIWFQADGSDNKLGIHYPIGFAAQGRSGQPPAGDENQPEGPDEMMQSALQQLEVLGPGKDDRQEFSTLQRIPGITAKVGVGQGNVVYELKVALHKSTDSPYAIGAEKDKIKLSMESGVPGERRSGGGYERGGNEGGEPPEGGGGGGGFRGGGRRGGGMGRGGGGRSQGSERPQQFKFEATIRLATSSTASEIK
ncbi:MAG TPA: hypothetical protein VLY03_04520 [Bacteroidota bacterium]|nr:hypothetical protein [Bacteroidota bacterium]